MNINLTRDSMGTIKSNDTAIILRGGHYWIFKDTDNPGRCLVKPGETLPFTVQYNAVPPCQTSAFPVEELTWQAEPWDMLRSHMSLFNCNFLRLWLTGGTLVSGAGAEPKPLDLTPFVRVKVGNAWKWQVFNAIVNNVWNEEYFRKLSSFAEKAENAGIVLQISLFNYLDLATDSANGNFRTWSRSPYNPALSDLPAQYPNWAKNHLVNPANISDEKARQAFFLAPTNSLRDVQQAIINKVVQTLSARTNVIYEIMNEPRGLFNKDIPNQARDQTAKFSSSMIDYIINAAGATRRFLISVNASNLKGGVFDVDYWSNNNASIRNYENVDAISYHGLSGYLQKTQIFCDGKPAIGVPIVDSGAIQTRFNKHRLTHSSKSLIYCTDGARTGVHKYPGTDGVEYELQVRDGQIYTNYPNANSDTAETQRKTSDLQNWAYWCFVNAVPNAGMVHFQNHSLYQMAYRRIRDALNQAVAVPVTLQAVEPSEVETAEAAEVA